MGHNSPENALESRSPRQVLAAVFGTLMLLLASESVWVAFIVLVKLAREGPAPAILVPTGFTLLTAGLITAAILIFLTSLDFKYAAMMACWLCICTGLMNFLLSSVLPVHKPYVVVRTFAADGRIESAAVHSRGSRLVSELEWKKTIKTRDGSTIQIENHCSSWRYALLRYDAHLAEDGSLNHANYEIDGWRALMFGVRLTAEGFFYTLTTSGILVVLLGWLFWHFSRESIVPCGFVNALAESRLGLPVSYLAVMVFAMLGLCG